MECFTNGYQALTDLESKENLSYEGIKNDLDKISSGWEDLEKETLSTLKETMEYFTQLTESEPKKSEAETILTRAKLLEEKFRTLLARHTKIGARANVYPSLVEERYQYSETMKNNIVTHGRRAWILFFSPRTDPWWSHSVDGMEQPDSSCSFWCSDRGRCIIDNWRVGLLHFCRCRGKRGQEMEATVARSVALARYG
ncbi:unnamed protein product [Porites lobata]|uniref:Uncharacterized protein n=1 Tax=Porites lobata TaxID=104759 RepID=A0ABN8N7C8_9CNID|nr:unnamed protein product [Porites lobata]